MSNIYFSNEDRQELLERINRKIELTLDEDDLDMEPSKRSSVIMAHSAAKQAKKEESKRRWQTVKQNLFKFS